MKVFFEKSKQLSIATVIKKDNTSYLVQELFGKTSKIKNTYVFFEFNYENDDFLIKARSLSEEINPEFLWEIVGDDEFYYETIASDYYGKTADPIELASLLFTLYESPIFFYKKGRGHFKPAPKENIEKAIKTQEINRNKKLKIEEWSQDLINKNIPDEIRQDLTTILFKPDKQSLTYLAFEKAATETQQTFFDLTLNLGLIDSVHHIFFEELRLKNYFHGFELSEKSIPDYKKLPNADSRIKAFSIDDSKTTEIDDAISLLNMENGLKQIGIHIAVPTIVIKEKSVIENIIFERMSTLYHPEGKVTMLPNNWINTFSLNQGESKPVLSLYLYINEEGDIVENKTKLEKLLIQDNLRIESIEEKLNHFLLDGKKVLDLPYSEELKWLYEWANMHLQHRNNQHEINSTKIDYSIEVDELKNVHIFARERGSILDIIVSELMIICNHIWASMLAKNNIQAVYRIQAYEFDKVKLSVHPKRHEGMKLDCYAWFTSPLRRATDYLNQKQLLSLVEVCSNVRFANNDIELFQFINEFQRKTTAYKEFQKKMETYWSFQYLKQNNLDLITGLVLKDNKIRVDFLPLLLKDVALPSDIKVGDSVRLKILKIDELNLNMIVQFEHKLNND